MTGISMLKRILYVCTVIAIAAEIIVVSVKAQEKDIVDTLTAANNFNTFVKAIQVAGLIETLKGADPFTVFAPTDEAFAKFQRGTIGNLLKPENKQQLTSIMAHHLIAGKVKASDMLKMKKVKTFQGSYMKIKVKGKTIRVDNAHIIKTDMEASNGVIHAIDAVVMPPGKTKQDI